jgi:subtilisin family serine protease
MMYSRIAFLLLITLMIICFGDNNNNGNNNDKNDNNGNNKSKKNLKPKQLSPKYDDKLVALDLSDGCLQDQSPEEILMSLIDLYPCLSVANIYESQAFRKSGNINRVYLSFIDDNSECLENNEIEWNDYCIEDISYDILFDHHLTCGTENTNSIYYGTSRKPNAWHLDLSEGSWDSYYKYPQIGSDGDHNVEIWILDSGIYASHKEFYSGQIIDEDRYYNSYTSPHGTGTAICAAGANYGVAKKFKIHDYPVCRSSSCAFSYIDTGLRKALNWMKTYGKRAVINMSLGSAGANPKSSTGIYFENLFQSIIDAGGIIVVSAGNDGVDACSYWFSYTPKVISVGAVDSNKARSSYSNYGPCVDIYAPGTQIPTGYSTTDPSNIAYVSGTSFSGPIVAGMVANILYEDNTRSKDDVLNILKSNVYSVSNCPSGYCYGTYHKCV